MSGSACIRAHLYQERDGYKNGKNKHSPQSVQVQRPASSPVHERDGNQRHYHHYSPDTDRRELGTLLRQVRASEQARRVVEHLRAK